ncbi:hypothetical protein [Saccharothrix hoggarensis]|uniref:ATP-grasp target RiPP n=1 Tax=Saccharothrix hoggarensis TaxID=913853 RepID=A0ABW3QKN6_9PSEU
MRQRNVSGTTVVVPGIPAEVEPDEVVDHPLLISGFELVETSPPKTKKTAVREAPTDYVTPAARTATVEE